MNRTCKRVPWKIAGEVALLPEMPEHRWREEAKRVIRRHMSRSRGPEQEVVRVYDVVLSGLVREVLLEG